MSIHRVFLHIKKRTFLHKTVSHFSTTKKRLWCTTFTHHVHCHSDLFLKKVTFILIFHAQCFTTHHFSQEKVTSSNLLGRNRPLLHWDLRDTIYNAWRSYYSTILPPLSSQRWDCLFLPWALSQVVLSVVSILKTVTWPPRGCSHLISTLRQYPFCTQLYFFQFAFIPRSSLLPCYIYLY